MEEVNRRAREKLDAEAITRVAERMYKIAADHGFHDADRADEPCATVSKERLAIFVANLHGEVNELWECVRRGTLDEACDKEGTDLSNAEEELADIVIRAMDTAHTLGIDLGKSISRKAKYNEGRPHMHGRTC